jgi:hypothetical protein
LSVDAYHPTVGQLSKRFRLKNWKILKTTPFLDIKLPVESSKRGPIAKTRTYLESALKNETFESYPRVDFKKS